MDYSNYEDLKDQYFELMEVGQLFYRTNNKKIVPTKLKSIKYRHGVDMDHVVYNLNVDNCNTFFANNMLSHNKGNLLDRYPSLGQYR
jgi:hypothetical protein